MLFSLFVIGLAAAIAIYAVSVQRDEIRTLRIAVNNQQATIDHLQTRLEHYEDVKRTVAVSTLVSTGEKPFWYEENL